MKDTSLAMLLLNVIYTIVKRSRIAYLKWGYYYVSISGLFISVGCVQTSLYMCVLSYLKVSPSLSFSLCSCTCVCTCLCACLVTCVFIQSTCAKGMWFVVSIILTYGKVNVGSQYAAGTVSGRKYSFTSQRLFLKLKVSTY